MHPDPYSPLPTPADVERRREMERLRGEVETSRVEVRLLRARDAEKWEILCESEDRVRRLRDKVERLRAENQAAAERCEARLEELRAALRAVRNDREKSS